MAASTYQTYHVLHKDITYFVMDYYYCTCIIPSYKNKWEITILLLLLILLSLLLLLFIIIIIIIITIIIIIITIIIIDYYYYY